MSAGPPQHARSVGRPTSHPSSATPDPTVGGYLQIWICRPVASGERWFSAPYMGRVAGGGVVRSPPPRYRLCPKVVRGTRVPPSRYRLPLASSIRQHDVAPFPAPAPCGPPRNPATLSTRHRVLPPWPTPQQPRHPLYPGPP